MSLDGELERDMGAAPIYPSTALGPVARPLRIQAWAWQTPRLCPMPSFSKLNVSCPVHLTISLTWVSVPKPWSGFVTEPSGGRGFRSY